MRSPVDRSVLARLRYAVLWSAVCADAARRGVRPRQLERVQRYLRSSAGLEEISLPDARQRPEHPFPRVPGEPWHEPADHPWTRVLEDAHEAIRAEATSKALPLLRHDAEKLSRGAWDVGYVQYMGRAAAENRDRFPRTARVLDSLPRFRGTGHAYFSLLAPHSHIKPHCGPINAWLRCHLGILVPQGCRMRVGDETRPMQEGKCLVFDDAFEHEVWNDSDHERLVLIIDFWHPDLDDAECRAMGQILRRSGSWRDLARRVLRGSRI